MSKLTPPEHISANPGLSQIWNDYAQAPHLVPEDAHLLSMLVLSVSKERLASAKTYAELSKEETDTDALNVFTRIQRDAAKDLEFAITELRLTPHSRNARL